MVVSGWKSGLTGAGLILFLLTAQGVWAAAPEDWSAIEQRIVKLFYPGQSSYQWLRSKDHKNGSNKVRDGDACVSCHEEEEEELGRAVLRAGELEPTPIAGKNGSIDLLVQAAHDTENIYLRFQWKTARPVAGIEHPLFRFDGKAWQPFGRSKLGQNTSREDQPPIYEDRLAIMIDDGSVPMFSAQGCWLTCHDGMADMKHEPKSREIAENPILGGKLHVSEVRKYLPESRQDDDATWSATKSEQELAELKASGHFLDLMQWHGQRTNAVGMADDGYLLEYLQADDGRSIYTRNWDEERNQPLFMFDSQKVGFKSRSVADIYHSTKIVALVAEANAVPFNADADWKEGDLIPQYLESRVNASGSAADNQTVDAQWKDSTWTVVWTRKLNTGHADDKVMIPGAGIIAAFAVHDDNVSSRGHFVSFPVSIGIGDDTGALITAHTLHARNSIANLH